jgi:hypothetical protein
MSAFRIITIIASILGMIFGGALWVICLVNWQEIGAWWVAGLTVIYAIAFVCLYDLLIEAYRGKD